MRVYSLHIDGTPIASFRTFGEANHAAFDDFVGFDWRDAATRYCATSEVWCEGQLLARYLLRQGRLALPLDMEAA